MGTKMASASTWSMFQKERCTLFARTSPTMAGRLKGTRTDVMTVTTRTRALLPPTRFDMKGATTPVDTPVSRRAATA